MNANMCTKIPTIVKVLVELSGSKPYTKPTKQEKFAKNEEANKQY